jgi:hypothetical protein
MSLLKLSLLSLAAAILLSACVHPRNLHKKRHLHIHVQAPTQVVSSDVRS